MLESGGGEINPKSRSFKMTDTLERFLLPSPPPPFLPRVWFSWAQISKERKEIQGQEMGSAGGISPDEEACGPEAS